MLKRSVLLLLLVFLLAFVAACAAAPSDTLPTEAQLPTLGPAPTTEGADPVPQVPTEPPPTATSNRRAVPTEIPGRQTNVTPVLPTVADEPTAIPFDDPDENSATGSEIRIQDATSGDTLVFDAPPGWSQGDTPGSITKEDNIVSVAIAPSELQGTALQTVAQMLLDSDNLSFDNTTAGDRLTLIATSGQDQGDVVAYLVSLEQIVVFIDQAGGADPGFYREEILQMVGNVRIE